MGFSDRPPMPENVISLKRELDLPSRSDDELMLLASGGSREAFETLVRRHARAVLGFCARSVGEPARGEEIAQEIWLSVWDHRRDFRAEGRFVPWLFTLARNRVRNAHRDAARRPVVPLDPEVVEARADRSPSELDRLIEVERRARVEQALVNVSPVLREALLLRFGQDLPYTTVAEALDTSESTARSRVFHGLKELRRVLRGAST